jgi:hypothetical protein
MTEQHSITPPPELVKQWHKEACKDPYHGGTFFESKTLKHIANQAAQWGANQELEACCEWFVRDWTDIETADKLCAARRPKPPSLKAQALEQLREVNAMLQFQTTGGETSAIRRALETLDD